MFFIRLEGIADAFKQMKVLVKFIYPAKWVGDQGIYNRAARKAERSLDPPSLKDVEQGLGRKSINEPVVAFGPPGSTGELNVSVIVSSIPVDFRIEAFGGPKEVGEALVKTITGSGRRPNLKGRLMETSLRQDLSRDIKYYTLEFQVESPTFQRHNVAVCCARRGRLFTLNAQAPESSWPEIKPQFYKIADSFILAS